MAVIVANRTAQQNRSRWMRDLPGRKAVGLQPTPEARVFDLRSVNVSGQSLAGKGELVFEGEALELGDFRFH